VPTVGIHRNEEESLRTDRTEADKRNDASPSGRSEFRINLSPLFPGKNKRNYCGESRQSEDDDSDHRRSSAETCLRANNVDGMARQIGMVVHMKNLP
jgi:hypothetical protein